MKKTFAIFVYLIIFSLLPIMFFWHIVEDDFADIIATADGLFRLHELCYAFYQNFAGVTGMTGFSLRPPLPAISLALFFNLFGHKTVSIFFAFLLPRILVIPLVFLVTKEILNTLKAYLAATITGFFLFFQTYALSTLKADSFVVLFTLMSLYFYLRWKRKNANLYLWLTGLFLAFNLLSKETAMPLSLVLFGAVTFDILRQKKISRLIYFLIPCVIFYGSYLLINFIVTKQTSPSFFASKLYVSTFFGSFKTYFLTLFYYAGINLNYGKLYSLQSLIVFIFLFSGVLLLLKSKKYVFVLIPFGLIFFICFLNYKNIQSGVVGNREILHRISPVVPFLSIYLFCGAEYLAKITHRFLKKISRRDLAICFSVFISFIFIFNYFRSPFALDYTDKEFYVNASTMLTNKSEIRFSDFTSKRNICIVKNYPQNTFMVKSLRKYRVSAFPKNYKEIIIFFWAIPAMLLIFLEVKHKKYD